MAGPSTTPQLGGAFDPTKDVTLQAGFSAAGANITWTAQVLTATGATGTTATEMSANVPVMCTVTGVSGAGIALPTGAAVPGALYLFKNMTTGVLKIYAVGGTINGTTGTTAVSVTATGNLGGFIMCCAAGAWQIVPIPT